MSNPEDDPGWQYLKLPQDRMMEIQSKPYDSKKNFWIPDEEEGYIAAELKEVKGDKVTFINARKQEVTVKKEQMHDMNPPKFECTEDMSNLSVLNDACVLQNLRARYFQMLIYTYSGLFCIVINPFKRLPIYTESVVKHFMGKRRNEVPPHLFAVSDEGYRNMLQNRENQSMLITGESGAGKTENTKKVISYFAVVGASQQAKAAAASDAKKVSLEDQIVQMNPVLEAFGNAKTVRNNNSSRFGKFIRIHFDKAGKLSGCDIEHYLLEKSRVVRQAPGERCYHIFYQLMSGAIPELKEKLMLDQELKYYHFVSQAELTIDGVDDKEEMRAGDEAFDMLGFSAQEKFDCFRLCSAHMHMGEMKFKQSPRGEQAEPDGYDEAQKTCAMYGINHELFLTALTKPKVKVGNDWVSKGQNLEQVNWAVGAMCKGIYARIFDWLVKKCNKTLDVPGAQKNYFIGVLDIAGFEIFDLNSFEQLWINFVNEKLQQFFNHHMFVLEQEEYAREGIGWETVDFGMDLAACIELIEKPMGVISMLDEECVVPKGTDLTYGQKMNDQHLGKHAHFQKPKPPKGKQAEAHFSLVHYAGTVRYNVINWLEKNKDPLNDTAVSVMKKATGQDLLLELWKDYTTQEEAAQQAKEGGGGGGGKKKGKSSAFITVSMLYRESLNNLMNMLHTTHPHFIRCIIPNELKRAGLIESGLVLNQLTCNGVLEGIRICRKGFPNRLLYPDFKLRYSILAAEAAKIEDPKKATEGIMDALLNEKAITTEEFRIGKTKIFFKAGVLAKLEEYRETKLSAIFKGLQARARCWTALKEVKKREEERYGYLVISKNVKSWVRLRTWAWFTVYGYVKPMLKAGKEEEERLKEKEKMKDMEENYTKLEQIRKELEEANAKLVVEKNELFMQLERTKDTGSDSEIKLQKMATLKDNLEKQLAEQMQRLTEQEERNAELTKAKKKVEQEADLLKKQIQELEMGMRKGDSEKQSKEAQIRSLQDEMHHQDELIAKLNREKKQQEEINRKMGDDLASEEDRLNHLNKVKAKLEQQLDDLEEALERERRGRQELEKVKRKLEGDFKVLQENLEEMNKQRHDLQNNLKKKEQEVHTVTSRFEDSQALVGKLQKQMKDMQAKLDELEEELNSERQARAKSEKARMETQRELEELSERLDEAGGATHAQVEMNKKREADLAKIRREMEEANVNHETQLSALRKKHNDAVTEMGDQLEQLQKQKAKIEKEKLTLQREIEELHAAVDGETRGKSNFEKQSKMLELQLSEAHAKCDEQSRQIADITNSKNRMQAENADLTRQLEEAESQLNSMQRVRQQLQSQLEEAKHQADDETRERQNIAAQLRNYQAEVDSLREQLEDEQERKNEAQRLVAKANTEVLQWRARFETEGLTKAEELEDAKRKLAVRLQEMQELLDQANMKVASLEKARQKLIGELDDAQVEVDRVNSYANQFEKKQKGFDKVVDDWKRQCDDLHAELDASQRESREMGTEVFKLKTANEELHESMEALRRENKQLAQEIKDMTDQLGEGGRSVHEMQKALRRLELEKEELQQALDEAEAALEAEESKVLRSQVEVSQIRQEIEKRIREKEEDFENTRKNHQRALESMQASLEVESKARAELMRVKKKLESDINELEIGLDHANKANADAQKNMKKYQEQIRELQQQVDEEQRDRDEIRQHYDSSEKRCEILQSEKSAIMTALEQTERSKKQAEAEMHDAREQLNELASQNAGLTSLKRKIESELQALRAEFDDTMNELKSADDRSKKAMLDAARLADELRQEQEHSAHVERLRKSLEMQIKEMQARLDEAENSALKGGKKVICKLEQRIRDLEVELDAEQRRFTEAQKNFAKVDRRCKELQFQVEEDKKSQERLQDLIENLQEKLKAYKRQAEEAEEVANINLAKYRQLQTQVGDAEERAEVAENSLAKLRAKNRSGTSMSGPGGGISPSPSVVRSFSKNRFMSSNALNE